MKFRVPLILLLLGALLAGPAAAQETHWLDADLARLPRMGTVLYVTAHPDDESGATLAYLSRGLHMRVVLIAFTRGEGWQNSTSAQLSDELRWVRTGELAAATATYGAELRFLGAPDFGYSKSIEEVLRIWDTETLLEKMVRQIRELQPVAVITAFSGTDSDGGGRHHQASAMIAQRAFDAAGDPTRFPEQLQDGLLPWKTPYLLARDFRGEQEGAQVTVPVQEIDPRSGKTFEEIGWEGYRNHASQGMSSVGLGGRRTGRAYRLSVTRVASGVPAPAHVEDLAPTLDKLAVLFPALQGTDWARLDQAVELAGQAVELRTSDAIAAARKLLEGAELLGRAHQVAGVSWRSLGPAEQQQVRQAQAWLKSGEQAYLRAVAGLAGVKLRAQAPSRYVVPGARVQVQLGLDVTHPEVLEALGLRVGQMRLDLPSEWADETAGIEGTVLDVPDSADPRSAPFPLAFATVQIASDSSSLILRVPVEGRGPDQTLEPMALVPSVTVEVQPQLRLLAAEASAGRRLPFQATLERFGPVTTVQLQAGEGTPLSDSSQRVDFAGTTQTVATSVSVQEELEPGRYRLPFAAVAEGKRFGNSHRRVDGGPDPYGGRNLPLHLLEPAEAIVQVVDARVPAGLRVGYVGFPDDPVPELLADLGFEVRRLGPEVLATGSLGEYQAIVLANRIYDWREDLQEQNQRLLAYVENGGLLLVEHQGRGWDPAELAPFPGEKPARSSLRVTDETASVTVLEPDHPVLNFPNRIGAADWEGWVQERGLYFWQSWPEQYTPLLEMADPGEEPLRGSLLYARYGKGAYIYCGLALFRQVRAGVPGGVRLYVNLLSQGIRLTQTAPDASE